MYGQADTLGDGKGKRAFSKHRRTDLREEKMFLTCINGHIVRPDFDGIRCPICGEILKESEVRNGKREVRGVHRKPEIS